MNSKAYAKSMKHFKTEYNTSVDQQDRILTSKLRVHNTIALKQRIPRAVLRVLDVVETNGYSCELRVSNDSLRINNYQV